MSMTPSSLDASFVFVEGEEKQIEQLYRQQERTKDARASHPSKDLTYSPGSATTYAHDMSSRGTGGGLRMSGRHFVDAYGRVCSLRGVNLSGSCKTPVDHDNSQFPGDHRTVTFVGRPFPLEEAHEHFSRLRRWGLTFIRFLVTWEAVEHAGPGIYDTEYLIYIRSLLTLLPQYGLTAFVSLHQDVWSRYCGGSGAPAWTLEMVGFDLHAIEHTGAAWLLGQRGGGHVEAERGLWPCGYQKLAAATMATLFWAGDVFAPKLLVKDSNGHHIPIQRFLQDAFLSMWNKVAEAVGDLEGVMGFQMMNEPHRGYINVPSLHAFDYNTDLHLSHVPSAFESFQLGAGHPTLVSTWTRSFPMPTKHTSHTLLNTEGVKAWRDDGPTQGRCLWEYHDVWRWNTVSDKAVPLRENYFRQHPDTGQKVEWYTDFYLPFAKRWAERVRRASSDSKLVFLEPIPNEFAPASWTEDRLPPNMVFAPHWYDLNALFAKAFGDFSVNVQGLSRGMFPLKAFYWGQKGARENYTVQIRNIIESGYKVLGETPVIIGECGIPMDMNKREAFKTDNFLYQERMMDAMLTALEKTLVGFTLWNYNPYNTDDHGDDWNGENFSWFSKSRAAPPALLTYTQTDSELDGGGRILSAVVRPYAAKTAGVPLSFEYEMNMGRFTYEWVSPEMAADTNPASPSSSNSVSDPPRILHHHLVSRETEIFIPARLTKSRRVVVAGLEKGDQWVHDEARQTLFVVTQDVSPSARHRIVVSVDPPPKPHFVVNDVWSDYGHVILSLATLVLSFMLYYFFMVVDM